MAIPLIPLIFGAAFGADQFNRQRKKKDRGILADTIGEARGLEADPLGQNIFNGGPGGLSSNLPGNNQQLGTGLMKDSSNPANQIAFAEQIAREAGGDALSQDIISGVLADERGNAQRDTELSSQQEFAAGQDELQRGFDTQAGQTRADALLASQAADREQRKLIADQNRAQKLASGENILVDTLDGGQALVPQQGTERWNEARETQLKSERTVETVGNMLQTLEESGDEIAGDKAGVLKSQWVETLFAFKDIFDTGVLSVDEIELIGDFVQDPTTLDGILSFDSTVLAKLENAQQLVQRRLQDQNELTRHYPGFSPSQYARETPRQLARRTRRESAAAALPPGAKLDVDPADRPDVGQRNAQGELQGPVVNASRGIFNLFFGDE